MAQRRMFSKELLESDSFLELSNDSKVVYFYLAIRCDDDGFSKCTKVIQRMLGLDDVTFKTSLNELKKAQLLYIIDNVFVIRDWKKNNQIQKDRYHSTEFKSILNKLVLIDKIYYLRDVSNMDTDCILSIDKSSIDKSSIDKSSIDKSSIDEEITQEMIRNIDSSHILNDNDINFLCGYIKTNNINDYVSYVIKYIKEKKQK